TWAAFTGGLKHAVVDGDFIMTAGEVQPVLRALRKADIHIVALHNHMVGEQPAFYFTHFWGKGPARDLGRGLRNALDAPAAVSMPSAHECFSAPHPPGGRGGHERPGIESAATGAVVEPCWYPTSRWRCGPNLVSRSIRVIPSSASSPGSAGVGKARSIVPGR